MSTFNRIPLLTAVEMLTLGLKTQIQAEVEAALLAVVLPRVKELAAQTATAMADHASVEAVLEPGTGSTHMLFSFNGDIYKDGPRV